MSHSLYQLVFQWPSLAKEKFQRKFWINLSNYGIAWGIWLARSDLVFNGRARIWDKIFFISFCIDWFCGCDQRIKNLITRGLTSFIMLRVFFFGLIASESLISWYMTGCIICLWYSSQLLLFAQSKTNNWACLSPYMDSFFLGILVYQLIL